ncbi:hypothetical protein LshimejAT787_0309470 [Lyophyllum shimeji]|uniref:Uncharacterized protein n=1 Tax=Lyophyllum shimeji TaxID=47721 RepID=A0A9P3PI95_LYOSH|nr:hypothetical protein LshimejAT787_0309470 [Lyophyllum shimeji]
MYTPAVRALMRAIVQSGCPRNKNGELSGERSWKVVSHQSCNLATKWPLRKVLPLVEMHHKINYDARHIQMRVPDYASGSLEPLEDSTPAIHLLGVESSADHSSELARDTWVERLKEAGELYNESPLAKRIDVKFTIRHLVHILRGMNGDYACFKGGNAEMVAWWPTVSKTAPMTLANKKNAAEIHPSSPLHIPSSPMSGNAISTWESA